MSTLAEARVETQSSATELPRMVVTTLYDVIAALNEQVGPEEDDAVTEAVMHLCQSGRLRRLAPSQKQG